MTKGNGKRIGWRRAGLITALVLLPLGPVITVAHAAETFENLRTAAPDLDPQILRLALDAVDCSWVREVGRRGLLTVIDYSLASTEPRLWVFDLEKQELLFHELVAHGVNTGENYATRFSNRQGSKQSSLGVFLTGDTYHGRNGYSLRLHGLEEGINHLALDRAIVVHGAWYVSEAFGREHGRLGRSWGCPALDQEVAREVIDTVKQGSLLFIYYPDPSWEESSELLNRCAEARTPTLSEPEPAAQISPISRY